MPRKSKSKKSGSKYRQCRSVKSLPDNWYEAPAAITTEAYLNMGLNNCQAFKQEIRPCDQLPRAKVDAYGRLCKIKGRSYKTKKQLCSSLRRKTHTKQFSPRCVNKRLADLVDQRLAHGMSLDDISKRGLRKAVSSIRKMTPQRGLTKLELGELLTQRKLDMQMVAQTSKDRIHTIQQNGKLSIQAVQQSGLPPAEIKQEIKDIQQDVKDAVQMEQQQAQMTANDIKLEMKDIQNEIKYRPMFPGTIDPSLLVSATAPDFEDLPPTEQPTAYAPSPGGLVVSIKRVSKNILTALINRWQLPAQTFPPKAVVGIQTDIIRGGEIRMYDVAGVGQALSDSFRYNIIEMLDNALRNTKNKAKLKLIDLLAFILELPLEEYELPYVYFLAQLYMADNFRGCNKVFNLKDLEHAFSRKELKDYSQFDVNSPLFPNIYPSSIQDCLVR